LFAVGALHDTRTSVGERSTAVSPEIGFGRMSSGGSEVPEVVATA